MFLSLFLILTIPTLVLTVLVTRYVKRQIEEQAIRQNFVIANIVSRTVGEQFQSLRKQVEDFSYRSKVIEFMEKKDGPGLRSKMLEFTRINPGFSRAFVTDKEGTLLTDYPANPQLAGKDFSDRDWFIGANARPDAHISEVYQRINMDKAYAVTICTRILDTNKQTIGFLAGQLTTDRLQNWFKGVKPAEEGIITLLDQNGRSLAGVLDPVFAQHPSKTNLLSINGWLLTNPSSGEKNLYSFVRVNDTGWTVSAYQPARNVFAPVYALLRTIALFSILCLIVAALLALYWSRTVSAYEAIREKNQQKLQDYATQLKRSNKELEAMCYSIAHDLRAPLRSMRGFALALNEDYNDALDECARDFVKRIGESAQRMDSLTQDLLDYGRLSHVEFEIRPVDLNLSLKKLLLTFSDELDNKDAYIEIVCPLPTILGNEQILEQVFSHLISNALKFKKTEVAPRIKIFAEELGNKVVIKVEDNGIGIDEAHHKKIFGVFERLHHHADIPGTGIGLAIVKRAVERLGGQITLNSKRGEGTCFSIELQKAKAAAESSVAVVSLFRPSAEPE